MNILHFNASDVNGGAARAAFRIHRSLVEYGSNHGLNSHMRVIYKTSDDPTILGGLPADQNPVWRRLRPRLVRHALRKSNLNSAQQTSVAWLGRGLGNELNRRTSESEKNLLHLHWIGDYQQPGDTILSIEEIGRLRQPLVWTLHDQWAFCGSEHYSEPNEGTPERFALGYIPSSRLPGEQGPDINRQTWLRKKRSWNRPIQIVCPSSWLANCVKRSRLMAGWPLRVIPNPVDPQTWAPLDKAQARWLIGLPQDRPLVLFGAIGGTSDPRKGADLLTIALQRLHSEVGGTVVGNLELVIFGQSRPLNPPSLPFPVHYCGRLNDDISLRLVYAAADVMVIPSRQDNLPNTGLEAQACGTPVVAFNTGGLADIVDDHVTGALAKPFDPISLSDAIFWVLQDPLRRLRLGSAARLRAEHLWNPSRIAGLYAEVYSEVFLTCTT